MTRSFLLFLGIRRHPLPPIARRSSAQERARLSALIAQDRALFPHYWS
jgi:hypothetical protein